MEIGYYDEDFCKSDIEDINDLNELKSMKINLLCEIDNSKERIEIYGDNVKVIQNRIKEIEK